MEKSSANLQNLIKLAKPIKYDIPGEAAFVIIETVDLTDLTTGKLSAQGALYQFDNFTVERGEIEYVQINFKTEQLDEIFEVEV